MTVFNTSRAILAPAEHVFSAISDASRLARWWGPAGFTNTFDICEFKTGGRWILTMHGPDGKSYPNEYKFEEIEKPKKVVIQHLAAPEFRLTIALTSSAEGTDVSWSQAFEDAEIAKRIEHIVIPANEQNLDRLMAEVMHKPAGG